MVFPAGIDFWLRRNNGEKKSTSECSPDNGPSRSNPNPRSEPGDSPGSSGTWSPESCLRWPESLRKHSYWFRRRPETESQSHGKAVGQIQEGSRGERAKSGGIESSSRTETQGHRAGVRISAAMMIMRRREALRACRDTAIAPEGRAVTIITDCLATVHCLRCHSHYNALYDNEM